MLRLQYRTRLGVQREYESQPEKTMRSGSLFFHVGMLDGRILAPRSLRNLNYHDQWNIIDQRYRRPETDRGIVGATFNEHLFS